jgi:ATP-binding cassette subfamily B protein
MTRAERRAALVGIAGRMVFAAAYFGAVALVVDKGIHGTASIGDVVLTVILAGLLNQQISLILDSVSRVMDALTHVDRYLWLVDWAAAAPRPDAPVPVPPELRQGITLEDVSFRYPKTDRLVLADVNLTLPAGQVVALVGDNGAGKTTLVKLLTGMYEPVRGRITVDGVDLRNVDLDAWRAQASAAFQDFARLELVFHESVGVGDLPHVDDESRVAEALRQAGGGDLLDTGQLGMDTPLGVSFEHGVDLSGGQWQKIALGRAMMRSTPLLLILDEPSASLDPAAERALFLRYASFARRSGAQRGGVTLLVSHRFSTVRWADLIVVMAGSRVKEVGNHDELMARRGLYAELYELQAASYR